MSELRRQACADVAKARRSNEKIIFSMGHHSVAEHSVFNFDLMEVSRLLLEEVESLRLASFTEKSQRYVTLRGDYTAPKEFSPEDQEAYRLVVEELNGFYLTACERLKPLFADLPRAEERAKEDARYILPLGTQGQLGMTLNARNLEHLFRKLKRSPLREAQDLAEELWKLVRTIAPSILLFNDPSPFDKNLWERLENHLPKREEGVGLTEEFSLIGATSGGDELILSLLAASRSGAPVKHLIGWATSLDGEEKREVYDDLFREMAFFDTPPREFEAVDLIFQAVVSASNFAQLKRHRLATLLASSYDLSLGVTVPPSLAEVGLEGEFRGLIAKAEELYERLATRYGEAGEYLLTNSHRRRVVVKMNLRELYHFVRLRSDSHAQWDIRALSQRLEALAKRLFPLAASRLCGKDTFPTGPGERPGSPEGGA